MNGISLRTAKSTQGSNSAANDQSGLSSTIQRSPGDTGDTIPVLDQEIKSDVASLRQRIKELEDKEKILERSVRQRQAECDEQKSALRTIQDEFMVFFSFLLYFVCQAIVPILLYRYGGSSTCSLTVVNLHASVADTGRWT